MKKIKIISILIAILIIITLMPLNALAASASVSASSTSVKVGDTVTIRFRVGGVFKNKKIAVYLGDTCIFSRKRPVLAPGEMETVRLKGADLRAHPDASCLTVTLEEA